MFSAVRLCAGSRLARLPGCVGSTAARSATAAAVCKHQRRSVSTEPAGVRVLYDGLCPICVTEIRLLQYLQRRRAARVDFIDISVPGYDAAKYGDVSFQMAMDEMHVIDENDKVHRGVPAFAVMYSAVGLGWLARFMMWSPVRPFMAKSYAIFAKNRLKWTGRGGECSTGSCERKTR